MENKSEIKQCQNCKNDFTIEPDDFSFYEKIKVPPPTWCPECRMIRRFSFQNTWNVYWRNCDKCGKKTLSRFSPEQKIIVYCSPCWWKDDWDGTENAMEYDPTRPFFYQLKELIEKSPQVALNSEYTTLKNSEYSNALAWSKDCYMVFWADYCDTVYYSSILNNLKHSSDCLRAKESELCYEDVGIYKCYQTYFSLECDACVDVWFSRNCYSCTNCIGCANLRGTSYCIFNVKYSKEEYLKKLEEFGLDSWDNLHDFSTMAHDFWLTKPKREHNSNSLNVNVTGECVFDSKNSKEMYIVDGAEDCKYCQFVTVPTAKSCFDYSGWGNNASMIYESAVVGENSSDVCFSYECWPDSLSLQYCYYNIACKNDFGCVSLKRKKYCILNKEYPKESFDKLRTQIIADMKVNPYIDKLEREYFYGEFFPPEMSKFSYNKSNAMKFLPKTKEEALGEGYSWDDREDTTYIISKPANLSPEKIVDTKDDILSEVIGCKNCGKGYKITQGEIGLLRKMNLPIPHECPKCRENKRFSKINLPKFYNRTCMKCNAKIYTPYAEGRSEIVYCVKCYQGEFL